MVNVVATFPKLFKQDLLFNALMGDFDMIAKSIKADFELTVATWRVKPKFETEITPIPGGHLITVFTEDDIYGWVSRGTKPHTIVPKNAKWLRFAPDFKAKTEPRVIGSTFGGHFGSDVFKKKVFHPGAEAREFEEEIAKKYGVDAPKLFRDAIHRALGVAGLL
jgi:hypothetical protein